MVRKWHLTRDNDQQLGSIVDDNLIVINLWSWLWLNTHLHLAFSHAHRIGQDKKETDDLSVCDTRVSRKDHRGSQEKDDADPPGGKHCK